MKVFTASSRLITLNNGVQMPALGLGVFLSQPEQTAAAVEAAIRSGYRLIDTAAAYFNERQVGEGIRRSGIDRSEMFVTTKLWMSDYGYDAALRAFDVSLGKLGLDYLDLYLLHWPVPSHFERTVASYRAAERLLAEGRTRAIGVSNFSATHLDNLLARAAVMPAVNQIELNPFFIQRDLRNTHEDLGIVTQAWSPIGGVSRNAIAAPQAARNPLEHPVIVGLGAKYGQDPCTDRASMAHRAWLVGDTEIRPAGTNRQRTSGSSTFSLRPGRSGSHRCAGHRRTCWRRSGERRG